ncbi:DUF4126 domain-containing protein [Robertkochia sediminum]|uniref:DUF4126 domain-containing protein n=1 Tax=Robertkochia sediminum TaxID=2785326 RepID=UPI001931D0AE|nr:DUF4126 domain-containing protein [Robertkochia sediminum]MBL7474139.1 DUF4126 domain-containing protein [Robertkochia sediminum]
MESPLIISLFLGIGLAAATGFRIFLPLFALSLAAYFDVWTLDESWQWLGSTAALISLGVAMVAELLAYYIPWVDNLLDSIALPLAGIAGTAVMVATMTDMSPLITWALAIIAGGGTATAVKGATASTRLGSSVSTAGLGNPVVSTVETASAVGMSILSFVAPVVAGVVALLILVSMYWLYRKLRPRRHKL